MAEKLQIYFTENFLSLFLAKNRGSSFEGISYLLEVFHNLFNNGYTLHLAKIKRHMNFPSVNLHRMYAAQP